MGPAPAPDGAAVGCGAARDAGRRPAHCRCRRGGRRRGRGRCPLGRLGSGRTVRVAEVVNCTGPLGDVRAAGDPCWTTSCRRARRPPGRSASGWLPTTGGWSTSVAARRLRCGRSARCAGASSGSRRPFPRSVPRRWWSPRRSARFWRPAPAAGAGQRPRSTWWNRRPRARWVWRRAATDGPAPRRWLGRYGRTGALRRHGGVA